MRTNIEIDDGLMAEAMKAGEFRTKREAVEAGLRLIKRQADYRKILKLKGKIQWGWGDEDRLDGRADAHDPARRQEARARPWSSLTAAC